VTLICCFEEATAIALAAGMLELLQKLHDKGFIHRDIKPANFVMSGRGAAMGGSAGGGGEGRRSNRGEGRLCLIDFGLAAAFEEEAKVERERGKSSTWGKQFFGTVLFASVRAHNGEAQSFRDDLEALVYVFAFFANGGLPWSGTSNPDKVLAMKLSALDSILAGECEKGGAKFGQQACDVCGGGKATGRVIRELLAHCRTLGFDARPDYSFCRQVLESAFSSATGKDRIVADYEWWHTPTQQAATPTNFYDLMM